MTTFKHCIPIYALGLKWQTLCQQSTRQKARKTCLCCIKSISLFLQWNISVNSLSSLVSMPINSLNVIQLFLVAFQTMNIPDSEVNDAERQLADHFNEILIQTMKNVSTKLSNLCFSTLCVNEFFLLVFVREIYFIL